MTEEPTTITDGISNRFTTLTWVLIPVGVAINVVGGALTNVLRIPLFLDAIGTLLLAILAGPFVAAVGGIVTNLVLVVVRSPTILPFVVTSVAIGLVTGYMAMRGWFRITGLRGYLRLGGAGIAVTIVAIATSWPIVVWLFGGLTGAPSDLLVGVFLAAGLRIEEAVLASELVIEPVDKIVSVVIAYSIAKSVPERYRPSFGRRALAAD